MPLSWAQLQDAHDAAPFGDGVDGDTLPCLVVELGGGYTLGDGNLDLHGGTVPGVLGLLDQGAVELCEHFLRHGFVEPGVGGVRCLGEDQLVEVEHGVKACFLLGICEVLERHIDGVGLLRGPGILKDAHSKRAEKAGDLQVDALLPRAVAEGNEFPAL